MKGPPKRPRLAFVVTLSLPTVLGCCPEKVTEGEACYFFQTNCSEHKDGCGSNGFSCVKGKWHEDFTYCNPPPFTSSPLSTPTEQPSAAPSSDTPLPPGNAPAGD